MSSGKCQPYCLGLNVLRCIYSGHSLQCLSHSILQHDLLYNISVYIVGSLYSYISIVYHISHATCFVLYFPDIITSPCPVLWLTTLKWKMFSFWGNFHHWFITVILTTSSAANDKKFCQNDDHFDSMYVSKRSPWCESRCISRADCRFAPSQWETSLQSNAISHWLGVNLQSALISIVRSVL